MRALDSSAPRRSRDVAAVGLFPRGGRRAGPIARLGPAARRHRTALLTAAISVTVAAALLGDSGTATDPPARFDAVETGAPGLAGRVPSGWSAVAIPLEAPALPLTAGQHVDVWAPAEAGTDLLDGTVPTGARRLTVGALVVDASDRRAVIAVGPDDVGAVAAALLDGHVVLALTDEP